MENEKFDFEHKIDELQKIVEKLESDISLEEGMKLFESGLGLANDCVRQLNKADDEISALKQQLDNVLISARGGNGER